ncbi:MAG: restriction endonuclease [Helicobacteraceae bacterium]|jgi:hypothetical protein|nr:restriction endonuclease [Helicobacteraceae bacterium]
MAIAQILKDISEFVAAQKIKLSAQVEDGRINASINESEVINVIKERFDIDIPRSRNWFDFSIENSSEFYPINIKITDTTHADNLSCKLGIYYALAGRFPDFPNEIGWLSYFEKLSESIKDNCEQDYYFLVINKQDTADVFVNSLKGLSSLHPNGNNLPFQCRWDRNRNHTPRSFNEAKDFILSNLAASVKLRSKIYLNFKKCFPQYA